VWRQKQHYQQRFAYGKPLGDLTSEAITEHKKGTRIRFKYDSTIFSPDASYDLDVISRRLRELAFLNGAATLTFKAVRGGRVARDESFHYDGGIAAYVDHITADAPRLHDCMHFKMFQDQSEVCSFCFDMLVFSDQELHR
jgi:DNA gyrase/topoisomerase IV subunit B